MLRNLTVISNSKWYWIALIILGVLMEGGALFYQHVLDELPCVMCIHVRIWVLAFSLVAIIALFLRRIWHWQIIAHALITAIMVGLFERSYMLLGTERGFAIASCNMDLGVPDWFALDKWLPSVFKVWTSCGYTPVLLFGITMAEALIVISALLVVTSGVFTILSVVDKMHKF